MKSRVFAALLLIMTAAALDCAWERKITAPDFRDAIADGVFNDLQQVAANSAVPDVPSPVLTGLPASEKSIYGTDDRLDYFEAPADIKGLSESVVSLWPSRSIRIVDGAASLDVASLESELGLCPGEKFAGQPIGAFCSGALVGEDLIITAGHCIIDDDKCGETKVVFGFALKKSGEFPSSVSTDEVYNCKKIIKRDSPVYFQSTPDYAVVQLDRKVIGHKPLAINKGREASVGDQLFMIGHPLGLPVKVAPEAKVRSTISQYYYMTDLDSSSGNSGSAVFNAHTKLIEGILVRGDVDFIKSPSGCKVFAVAPQNGGTGEAVTKIFVLKNYIP